MSKPDIESVDKYFGTQMDTQTTRVVVNLPRVCERKNGKFVCSRVYFKVVVWTRTKLGEAPEQATYHQMIRRRRWCRDVKWWMSLSSAARWRRRTQDQLGVLSLTSSARLARGTALLSLAGLLSQCCVASGRRCPITVICDCAWATADRVSRWRYPDQPRSTFITVLWSTRRVLQSTMQFPVACMDVGRRLYD